MSHIVVIGAGFAGLGAAFSLLEAGHRVTVLEASNRVRGRVTFQELDKGAVVEHGGEWIAARDDRLRYFVKTFGLSLAPLGVDFRGA